MARGLWDRLFASWLYDLSLGNSASMPEGRPPPIWPASISKNAPEASFEWLSGLSDSNAPLGAEQARERVGNWLANNLKWDAVSWRPDHLADRLAFGLTHFDELCADAPDGFGATFARALNRQARHLFRLGEIGRAEADNFRLWRGAIIAALHLPGFRRQLPKAIKRLEIAASEQILADGGHFARSPQAHLDALAALVQTRAALFAARVETPERLQITIDRMAPILRAYCHADGGLALFNGAHESNKVTVECVLDLSGSVAKPASSAPHTGFHRISAQRTTVIFDAGTPADSAPLVPGHAGTLSFEMSVGPHRMIVNCGSVHCSGENHELAQALRATAAHSTLTVANTHSADLVPGAGYGDRRARNVLVRRREQDRNVLVEGQHDGYAETFGLIHRRSLYLARDGLDLRGEDILEGTKSTGQSFDIRFHLHPSARASLVGGGRSVLLRLPTGRVWRLEISEGTLSLEGSVYAGGDLLRQTSQIIISDRHTRQRTINKWRLAREV